MTQNKLKLLTILTNFLATHLLSINRKMTCEFVSQLISLINLSFSQLENPNETLTEQQYHHIQKNIPANAEPTNLKLANSNLQKVIVPFGFNLLLEMTYLFIVQCKSVVVPKKLKYIILEEYKLILESLEEAEKLYYEKVQVDQQGNFQAISDSDFQSYFHHKRRMLNLQMLILCDFIGYSKDQVPTTLINHIQQIGEIQEVRAVANKSISINHSSVVSEIRSKQHIAASELLSNPKVQNNLYVYWLVYNRTKANPKYSTADLAEDLKRVTSKIQFLNFIQDFCTSRMQISNLKQNPHFDEKIFQDTITLISQYYQLEDELTLLMKTPRM